MKPWNRSTLRWLALVSPCVAGCPADPGGADETTASTTEMGATATVATEGTVTAGDGNTDTDTDTEGPSYPDCAPPGTATVELAVTVDGTNEVFGIWDDTPTADIDGPCDVVAADPAAGVLSLSCMDLEGIARTVDIEYASDPPVTLVLDEGPVDLFFDYVRLTDEVDAEPPSEGTSFAISQGGRLRLAGLDGQYSSGHAAWDALLPASVQWSAEGELCELASQNPCYGIERRRATFEVDGGSATLFDRDSAVLGELMVVLERMDGSKVNPTPEDSSGGDPCCCHGPPSFFGAQFLIGTPG